jgi:hypothetical protein
VLVVALLVGGGIAAGWDAGSDAPSVIMHYHHQVRYDVHVYSWSRFRLSVSAGSQKTTIHSEPEGTSLVFSGCANFSRTWVFLLHGCQYIEETRRTRLLLSKDTVIIGTVLGQTNKRVPLSLCLKRLLVCRWALEARRDSSRLTEDWVLRLLTSRSRSILCPWQAIKQS